MPRSRGTETAPPARTPLHLRTTACSEANHRTVAVDRSSPKVGSGDRPSPRSPLLERKRAGTRVAELEAKLGKVQEELKKLRAQLASAEAAKKDAQVALEAAKKGTVSPAKSPATVDSTVDANTDHDIYSESQDRLLDETKTDEVSESSPATDVFEVRWPSEPAEITESETAASGVGGMCVKGMEAANEETKKMIEKFDNKEQQEDVACGDNNDRNEVDEMKAKLTSKEQEVERLASENAELKASLDDARAKVDTLEQELAASREREQDLGEQLKASNGAKESMELDMRRIKIQTEQWRKAAEAAAAVIASVPGECGAGADTEFRRSEARCASMDKHQHAGGGGSSAGYGAVMWGSPMIGEEGDDCSARRRGPGIRVLGDLWKKKGQMK